MVERKPQGTAGDKTIYLPIAEDIDSEAMIKNTPAFRV
jgi:hypothetical protein